MDYEQTTKSAKLSHATTFNLIDKGVFPSTVVCAPKCKFCYEGWVDKLMPWVNSVRIPRHNDETFSYLLKGFMSGSGMQLRSGFYMVDNEIQYYSNCDHFSLGFSVEQMGAIADGVAASIGMQDGSADTTTASEQEHTDIPGLTLYTTGMHAEPDDIVSLRSKHAANLHFSAITFDPRFRPKLMSRAIDVDKLKQILGVLGEGDFIYLFYLDAAQVSYDLEVVNEFSNEDVSIILAKMYYTKLDDGYLVDYTQNAKRNFTSILRRVQESSHLIGKRKLYFHPEPEVVAYSNRDSLKELLSSCTGAKDEAVFCSAGAYPVIKDILHPTDTHVVPLQTEFGGCVSFPEAMTVKIVAEKLSELEHQGIVLKRLVLPSTIFHLGDQAEHDIRGDTLKSLNELRPDLDVSVINIPWKMVRKTTLSLAETLESWLRIAPAIV